jgi:hypothetical protein
MTEEQEWHNAKAIRQANELNHSLSKLDGPTVGLELGIMIDALRARFEFLKPLQQYSEVVHPTPEQHAAVAKTMLGGS